jgi:formate dehydrogenase subunit gamma
MTEITTFGPQEERTYERFPLARRIEHVTMLLSFSTLGLTGLVQKYALSSISQFLVNAMGGIENVRAVHHFAAIILMFGTMYHIIVLGYNLYVLRMSVSMLPVFQDAKDALQALMYNIGFGKSRPQMGRFTFEEKAEYWAFVWGTVVMGLTGFLMWNPITAAKFLPGEFIPAAKAAHGGEAVLAVLAIILWHMYGVHIKFFNKAMWTGKLTEEQMLHEHPLELADIKAGIANRRPSPELIRKRQKIYFPIASILTIGMLAGIYGFINGEDTALKTVPPQDSQQVEVYVHQTPTARPTSTPTATPLPLITPSATSSVITWEGNVSPLLQERCGVCHGAEAASGGLIVTTYADLMLGGKDGPAIIPNDSANSLLIKIQSITHFGSLTPKELALVKQWIDTGTLEK